MKKTLLILLLAFVPQFGHSLIIQNFTVSALSDTSINVQVNTQNNYTFGYNSYQLDITNNVITLNICYDPGFGAAISYLQNDFMIPLDNTSNTTYQLIVNVFFSNQSAICDYQTVEDSGSVTFDTPLTEPVSLNAPSFDGMQKMIIYPNPTTGILNIEGFGQINEIQLFDQLGRFISKFNESSSLDLHGIKNGVYYLLLDDATGSKTYKVLKN
ncbi:MAG TPA: T9SS type A sorting domain-containing protein [Flavobacterium sp.]|jgi:hypothetical protein